MAGENKEKKKCEFPDAFMIAKLKKICSNESPIYVITKDKGFKEAIKSVTGLEGKFDNLKDIFDLINRENEIHIYNEIKELVLYKNRTVIKKNVTAQIILKGSKKSYTT